MSLKPLAFIYVSQGADPERDHTVFYSQQHAMAIYGVPTIEEGCQVAQKIVQEGCKIIELCGGFGPEGAEQVIRAIGGVVPVGYIYYSPEENEKRRLQKLEEMA